MIHFEKVSSKNVWEICKLEVSEEQSEFVATNLQSLAEAFAVRNDGFIAEPFGVYDGKKPIGFVMIGKGSVGDENEPELFLENYCLWRLMVDKNEQKKGYGREIMKKAIEYIKTFPHGKAEYIWLSYDRENETAKKLYAEFGFSENGMECDGEIVAVMKIMHSDR